MTSKFTTKRVGDAVQRYTERTATAPELIAKVLQNLCQDLIDKHLDSILQASHWAVILEVASSHARAARQKGWALPSVVEFPDEEPSKDTVGKDHLLRPLGSSEPLVYDESRPLMDVRGMIPYWMSAGQAVGNDMQLQGIFLLTAPNMSGKSTLMRSILVVALLANCGLFAPCSSASVPRYDNFFLRTASYDIPSEEKSAFALECDDVSIILRDCSDQSLVMVDELGKGTSSRDGTSFAATLLTRLDQKGVSGIFATHLHEIFQLMSPRFLSVREKRMGYQREGLLGITDGGDNDRSSNDDDDDGAVKWTYHLEEGRDTDSKAIVTAEQYHIDKNFLCTMRKLQKEFDREIRRSDGNGHYAGEDRRRFPKDLPASQLKEGSTSSSTSDIGDIGYIGDSGSSGGFSRTGISDSAAEAVGVLGEEIAFKQCDLARDVVPLLAGLQGSLGQPVVIGSTDRPPAVFEGRSCLYVLQISSVKNKGLPSKVYVGESDSVFHRVHRHRQECGAFYAVDAALVTVSDKSTARRCEMELILDLKRKGFFLERVGDENNRRFGAS